MIQAFPKSWFSWNYKILENSQQIAELDISSWREKGEIRLDNIGYTISREGILIPALILERERKELARVTKSGFLRNSFSLIIDGKHYVIHKRSLFSRAISLSNDIGKIGSITPVSFFSRKAEVNLPEEIPLHLRLFVVWLALLLWKRESDAASSGSS